MSCFFVDSLIHFWFAGLETVENHAMLCLTQTTGYAIKALGCLSQGGCRCQQTADVAKSSGVPKPYLSKIIQSLARAGLVVAKRGIGGGISLACPPEGISLLQVVEAVEGQAWLGDCLLGFDECTNMANCPTHDFWQRIRREITRELRKTSLACILAFKNECETASRRAAKPRGLASASRVGRRTVGSGPKKRGASRLGKPVGARVASNDDEKTLLG